MSRQQPPQQGSNINSVPLTTMGGSGGASNDNGANSKLLNEKDTADGPNLTVAAPPDPLSEVLGAPQGFNAYRNKKTLTQGMMDIALFSANANQLRYVLENGSNSVASYYIAVVLIITSLVLQIAVGLLLLLSVQYDVMVEGQRQICYKYANYVIVGTFLVTVVNVFIVAFGNYPVVAPVAS